MMIPSSVASTLIGVGAGKSIVASGMQQGKNGHSTNSPHRSKQKPGRLTAAVGPFVPNCSSGDQVRLTMSKISGRLWAATNLWLAARL